MRLQIHMHIHIRILNSANRLDVVQPETLGDLTEVRRRHGIQEPGNDPLNRPRLLLRQFVYHCRLRYALDVDVVRRLPRAEAVIVVVVAGARGLGGVRPRWTVQVRFIDA